MMRAFQFASGSYYHIFNRGVDKRKIFLRYGHYSRFIQTIRTLLNTGSATIHSIEDQSLALKFKVEILSHCLMPNHYHFLIHQTKDNGITEFMHNLNTSYTLFFNKNNDRSGRLFEYTFKAKEIETEKVLLQVSRYIHINPIIAHLVSDLSYYPWSSYLDYMERREHSFCETATILSFFDNDPEKYRAFIHDQIAYAQLLHRMKQEDKEENLFL